MAGEFPALADMLRVFGSRQIRNRATMGGNLVTASPIGDSAPLLLALDAKVVLVSLSGRRGPMGQAGRLPHSPSARCRSTSSSSPTARPPCGQARFSRPSSCPGSLQPGVTRKCAWYKVSKRREMDISTVAACFTVDLDSGGVVRHARLAYGGVAPMPARARKAEQALLGKRWCEETVSEVLPMLQAEFTPISDLRGSAEYRRGLITSLFEKFFFDAEQTEARRRLTPLPQEPERPHARLRAGDCAPYLRRAAARERAQACDRRGGLHRRPDRRACSKSGRSVPRTPMPGFCSATRLPRAPCPASGRCCWRRMCPARTTSAA